MLADCPGHVQYTRNTVTGSSTADAVVLLVDARKGVLEQTRRHLAVAALMRVPHVVVAVNKIDLVDHSEEVFRTVAADVRAIAAELGIPDAHAVPVSALVGDNVVDRSPTRPGTTARPPRAARDPAPGHRPRARVVPDAGAGRHPPAGRRPLAEHVEYRGYAGQLASGSVRVGDEVVVLRPGSRTTVVGIDLGERSLEVAVAPQSVSLRLADDVDVSRGDLIAAAADPVPLRQEVTGRACWLGDDPCAQAPGCSSSTAPARCSRWSAPSTAGSTSTPCGSPRRTRWPSTTSAASPCGWPRRCRSSTTRPPGVGAPSSSSTPDDGRTLAAAMADAVAPAEHPR